MHPIDEIAFFLVVINLDSTCKKLLIDMLI